MTPPIPDEFRDEQGTLVYERGSWCQPIEEGRELDPVQDQARAWDRWRAAQGTTR